MLLNVNMNAVVQHTKTLEQISRSALPVAVRTALNSAAFDVKKNTMPTAAAATFEKRQPNFFKANSKVDMAKGFEIKSMRAIVGFVSLSGTNHAVDDLQQQEHGGNIGGRSFIPMNQARVANSPSKLVRKNLRMQILNNMQFIDAHKVRVQVLNDNQNGRFRMVRGRNKKQQYIRAAFKAKELYGNNAFVLGNVTAHGRTLSLINSISTDAKHRVLTMKRTPLYTFEKGRHVRVAATNFMKRASLESGIKLDKFYVDAAEKQIAKIRK